MKIAIVLHVGAEAPLAELLQGCRNVKSVVSCDLFVNLVEGKVVTERITSLILADFPTATVVTTENRGMDIGGFLRLLPLVHKYDLLLKLHTKTSPSWRRSLLSPLCGSPTQVARCLRLLQQLPSVGMLGSSKHLYREPRMRRPNYYRLRLLTEQLSIPYTDCTFVGGTMFWVRTSMLQPLWSQDCETLRTQLNDSTTFDPYWYLINYRDVRTLEQATTHWEEHGQKLGRFRNCLHARDQGATRYLPDGMIEHAYERVFGLCVTARGGLVFGV